MLILSRKPGEKIIIGDKKQLVITVLKRNGSINEVYLGFDAVNDLPINREEIYNKKYPEENET